MLITALEWLYLVGKQIHAYVTKVQSDAMNIIANRRYRVTMILALLLIVYYA